MSSRFTQRRARSALAMVALMLCACSPALASDPGGPRVDEGRIIDPAAATGGPAAAASKTYGSVDKNFIIRWMTNNAGVNGTLDDDLVGEATIAPVCSGDRLSDAPAAQYVYTNGYSYNDGRMYSNWYAVPGSNMDVVRYYVTQVESLRPREVDMLVGADDGIRVWLNGEEVLRQDPPAEYEEAGQRVRVSLREGWNLLLVKVYYPQLGPQGDPDHEYMYWSLRFAQPDTGEPVLDVYQSVDGWCSADASPYGWAFAPGVADSAGAFGSQWRSEFRVTNPYYHNLRVLVQFFGYDNTTGAPDGERVLRLAPFETVTLDNLVRELTGVADAGAGMIAVNGLYYLDAAGYDAARLITANVGGEGGGQFGTQMPFGYRWLGSSCCSQQLYGLRNGPGNRTNLLVIPTPFVADEVALTVNLWDPESGRTESAELTGRGAFQVNDIFGRVGMGDVRTDSAIAHITYSSTASRANLRIVASINDNVTSDPTLVGRAPYGIPTPFQ